MSSPSDLQPTFIFIPDISGFTSFINEVEIDHSTHIITELLEIIIEANILDLKVSEIEGDAVLFYRVGPSPSFEEIVKQVEVMFIEFHQHLKLYERDRICQCGACSGTGSLSLKFVCHTGDVTIRNVANYQKLFGPAITLTHRLLKNGISNHEYLLLTSTPPTQHRLEWVQVEQGKYHYDGIGEVVYSHLNLSPLKSKVPELPVKRVTEKHRNPVTTSITINTSMEKVHEVVTNVALKPYWILGLKAVKQDNTSLDIVGSNHMCIMSNKTMDIEIDSHSVSGDVIEFVERTNDFKIVSSLITIYTIQRIALNQTKITLSIHYQKHTLSNALLNYPFRLFISISSKLSLLKLRKYINRLPS